MNHNQMLTKLEETYEAHNALVLNVGDYVFARYIENVFVICYVYEFDSEIVTFRNLDGTLWSSLVKRASADTFLIARFEDSPKGQLIAEIMEMVA